MNQAFVKPLYLYVDRSRFLSTWKIARSSIDCLSAKAIPLRASMHLEIYLPIAYILTSGSGALDTRFIYKSVHLGELQSNFPRHSHQSPLTQYNGFELRATSYAWG